MEFVPGSGGGGGSGTVTSVGTAGIATGGPITTSGTVTVAGSGNTTTAATADSNVHTAPAGDVVTTDGSGNVQDSGTLLSSLAPLASPTFTGTPAAPTATAGTNTTQLATTAFVAAAVSASGAVLWSNLGNAAGNLTLANGTNTTTFNQTSNTQWTWANTTTATVSTTNNSPIIDLEANAWNGSSSIIDQWQIYSSLAAGTNGTSTLNIAHIAGSSGVAAVSVPAGTPGTAAAWGLTFAGTTLGLAASSSNLLALIGSNPILRFYNGATDNATVGATGSGTLRGLGLAAVSDSTNSSVVVAGNIGSNSGVADVVIGGQISHTNTTGTSYGVSIGNGTSNSTGFELFAPSSGTGTYVGLNVNPKISQTSTASGSYTAVLVNVVETGALGTANKLLTLQGGTTGGTTRFEVNSAGVVDTYNSITTVANGMPAEYATVNSTGNAAAITTTTFYAVPAAGTGIYRVSYYLLQTTAATSSAALQLTVGWTDSSSTAQTATSTSLVSNLVGAETSGSFIVQSANSQNITYAVSYTSVGLTAAAYSIYLRLEALG